MIGFKAGARLIKLTETDSTNSYAARLLHLEIPEEGTVIMADFQKSGRGQRGGTWESESGKNLLISYILYPDFLNLRDHFALNQAISLAVADFISKFTSAETAIKWPNDILVQNKKIAGILIENSIRGHQITNTIVGIGININQQTFQQHHPEAISLALLENKEFDLKYCLTELNRSIEKWYMTLRLNNFKKLTDEYAQFLFRKDVKAEYESEGKRFSGTIKGVNQDGKLQITDESGNMLLFANKEVKFIY